MDFKRSAALGGRGARPDSGKCRTLGESPFIGHIGRALGTYEWVIPGLPYILIYRVLESEDWY
jgi:hypothetical protein